jgi:hypothetical protein
MQSRQGGPEEVATLSHRDAVCASFVIPAKAGIQRFGKRKSWIPAFAGMTS